MPQLSSVSKIIQAAAKKSKRRRAPRRNESPKATGLDSRFSDAILLAILFAAPLIMGGRTELGRAVYVGLVGLLFVVWSWERTKLPTVRWVSSGVEWLLVAGLCLIVLQLVPLSAEWISKLSPSLAEFLPLWDVGGGGANEFSVGDWNRLSLTPHATLFGMCVFVAHAMFFVVLVQKLQSTSDVERLLRWIALAVTSLACIGIVQYLSGTEKFLWIFRHPSRDADKFVCGPFSNSNHFAHFLALGIGPLIWWMKTSFTPVVRGPTGNVLRKKQQFSQQQVQLLLLSLALGVVLFAGLLARSRGGILMILFAVAVSVLGLVVLGAMPKRALWLLTGVAGLVALSLFIHGSDAVEKEMESLASVSLDELDQTQGRRRIWAANMEASRRFRWLGTGVGSHAEVYHLFFPHPSRVEYKHAESGYINVLTETGVAGLGLVIAGALVSLWWCFRIMRLGATSQTRILGAALLAGLLVSVTHAVFDFHWYLASCMSLTIALCACACRLSLNQRSSEKEMGICLGPALWRFVTVGGCGFVALALAIQVGPAMASVAYNEYLHTSLRTKRALADRLGQALDSRDDHEEELRRGYERNRLMVEQLNNTLKWDSYHPRANLRLASLLVKSFDYLQQYGDNAMGLVQISDAAHASAFATIEAQDEWLEAAVGTNLVYLRAALRHTQRGLSRCPLLGRGYLYWADLAFLEGGRKAHVERLFEQAFAARPYDPAVLFALGRQAAMAQNPQVALDLWKKSFHQGDEYRDVIIRSMANWIPPQLFVEHFEPDRRELTRLVRFYVANDMAAQAQAVAPKLIEEYEKEAETMIGAEAAQRFLETIGLCRLLGDQERATEQARHAAHLAPNMYEARRIYAYQLLMNERFDEAIEQFVWCVRRRPSDEKVKHSLNIARNLRRKSHGLPGRVATRANSDAR
jgi:hypothetical protein